MFLILKKRHLDTFFKCHFHILLTFCSNFAALLINSNYQIMAFRQLLWFFSSIFGSLVNFINGVHPLARFDHYYIRDNTSKTSCSIFILFLRWAVSLTVSVKWWNGVKAYFLFDGNTSFSTSPTELSRYKSDGHWWQ